MVFPAYHNQRDEVNFIPGTSHGIICLKSNNYKFTKEMFASVFDEHVLGSVHH